jgi:ATP-dependent protease ClpP protease subunit
MAEISLDQVVAIRELQAELAFKHGVDTQQRSFWITGEINDKMLKHVEGCLAILENDSSKAITIRINSGGGECYAALAIVSRMQSSKCKIKTEGHGHIMSAATLILAAGYKRSISKWASFMWHEPTYGVYDRQSNAEAWVEQYKKELQNWCELMASLSNHDSDFWMEKGKHTDKFFSPEQLLELNIVDKVF